ncbi:MAG: HAD family hydrolase [Pseudomonadota bacterium]
MRIAMWSGPRNLSTALMYAFGARADCAVVDEPFYACFLARTGLAHPMRDDILASQPTDPDAVVAALTGPVPEGKPYFYQKHMCHHMVDGVPHDWISDMRNVFLIRHPARVIASYAARHETPRIEDTGVVRQLEMIEALSATGDRPLIIDSADIRAAPEPMLRALCTALGLPWDGAMLHWPAGGHRADGVWAAHWYGAVHRSTGFAGPEGALPVLEGAQAALLDRALPFYETLKERALKPPGGG